MVREAANMDEAATFLSSNIETSQCLLIVDAATILILVKTVNCTLQLSWLSLFGLTDTMYWVSFIIMPEQNNVDNEETDFGVTAGSFLVVRFDIRLYIYFF
jgi:hypothetical protein